MTKMPEPPKFPDMVWDFTKPPTDEQMAQMTAYFDQYQAYRKHREQFEVYRHEGFDFDWPFEIPPIEAWEAAPGTTGAIAQAPMPGFNGYVLLPANHRYRQRDLQGFGLDDPRDEGDGVDVPGGVTFGPHVTGWVGFDTGHAWDHWDWALLTHYRDEGLVSDEFWEGWVRHHTVMAQFGLDRLTLESPFGVIRWTLPLLKQKVEELALQIHLTTTEGTAQ